jgi:hypothetical protein
MNAGAKKLVNLWGLGFTILGFRVFNIDKRVNLWGLGFTILGFRVFILTSGSICGV